MSVGYIDPATKKYVKKAGDLNVMNTPVATENQAGLCSPEQVKKIDKSYTADDVATKEQIDGIFN